MTAPHALLAAALIATATAAPAQDSAGTITGRLDTDPVTFQLDAADGDAASGWRSAEDGRVLHLVGTRSDGALGDTLTVEIVTDGTGTPSDVEATVTYRPAGDGSALTAAGQNADLTVNALNVQGDEIAINGDLVATMTPGGSDDLIVDPGPDAMVFDGNFQATLVRFDD